MAVFTIGSSVAGGSPGGGGPVGGGGNLTTVGAVPYVVSSGVLGQDALWNWDSTNKRLVSGNAATGNSTSYNTYAVWGHSSLMTAGGIALVAGSAGDVYLNSGPSAALSFRQNATEVARFAPTTGNFLLGGGTTDGNYKFDVNRSGSTGTHRIFDQGVTGSTLAVIQAGAAQSSNPVLSLKDNAGSSYANFNASAGAPTLESLQNGSGGFRLATAGAFQDYFDTVSVARFRATAGIAWSSDTNWYGTKDLGLARNAAGVLEINNGTAGTLRDLKLRYLNSSANSTGAGSALLGANSPAVTLTAPYTWVEMRANDGSTVYFPVWK